MLSHVEQRAECYRLQSATGKFEIDKEVMSYAYGHVHCHFAFRKKVHVTTILSQLVRQDHGILNQEGNEYLIPEYCLHHANQKDDTTCSYI